MQKSTCCRTDASAPHATGVSAAPIGKGIARGSEKAGVVWPAGGAHTRLYSRA